MVTPGKVDCESHCPKSHQTEHKFLPLFVSILGFAVMKVDPCLDEESECIHTYECCWLLPSWLIRLKSSETTPDSRRYRQWKRLAFSNSRATAKNNKHTEQRRLNADTRHQ
mmetsp:Transcript_22771/g.45056  ORF Transcript_22771/g.45056 Transcript_22771/m.45056 type:complete len:111 (+) Transcript_22771:865-1197(+)